jgi:hypothetical protein
MNPAWLASTSRNSKTSPIGFATTVETVTGLIAGSYVREADQSARPQKPSFKEGFAVSVRQLSRAVPAFYLILTNDLPTAAMLSPSPRRRRHGMAQILIVADPPGEDAGTVVYRERIASTDLESNHFSGQLVERVGWAVRDADRLEHENLLPMSGGDRKAN